MSNKSNEFYSVSKILSCLERPYELLGNKDVCISSIMSPKTANKDSLTWFSKNFKDFSEYVESTNASIVVCDHEKIVLIDKVKLASKAFIVVDDPRAVIAKIGNFFFTQKLTSAVDSSAKIEKSAKIDSDVFIGANCYIGNNVVIKSGSIIYPGCTIGDGTIINSNVLIYPGVVIGYNGFGFTKDNDGTYEAFPHLGRVIIEENVD